MLTSEQLEAAYKRGLNAGPDSSNPYQHQHPALRQAWDNGQHKAFMTRVTKSEANIRTLMRVTIFTLAVVLLTVGACHALQIN